MSVTTPARITITFRKPWLKLYAGIRPTLVIGGRGQPTQWGEGTWQVPADQSGDRTLSVYLFNRMWRFGLAEIRATPDDEALIYVAPVLPFGRGRIRAVTRR